MISVISFIATTAVTLVNSVRAQARNTKRNSDVAQLIKAFQLGADNSGGVLPLSGRDVDNECICVSTFCEQSWGPAGWGDLGYNVAVDNFIGPYIKKPQTLDSGWLPLRGYLYCNPKNFDKGVGAYLLWFLEADEVTSSVCGPGYSYVDASPDFLLCQARLDD